WPARRSLDRTAPILADFCGRLSFPSQLLLILVGREQSAGVDRQLLDDWAKGERWKESESTDNHNDADDQADKQAACRREGAGRCRYQLLARKRACDDHGRNDHPEPADRHRHGAAKIVEERVAAESREGRAIVAVH